MCQVNLRGSGFSSVELSVSREDDLYIEGGETLLDITEAMMIELPQLPPAHGWLHILQHEDGVVLFGYDQNGRFITYLNRLRESVWSFRPPRQENAFVFEAFGSRETIVDFGDGLLGVYGATVCGLIVIDSNTGQYHIPGEDRICAVAAGGIWVGGLVDNNTGVVALLGTDGSVLREVEHSTPVIAIGAFEDPEANKLPFYGTPNRSQVLGERDSMVILQHKNEVYAVAVGE